MMCEGGKIDWACHANDAASTIHDTQALADAVQVAIDFAKEHADETLILVTGDHETGGLTIGFAGTDYDTYLDLLESQKISYAKFDSDYVSSYKENKTSFEDVLKDVEELFGLKPQGEEGDKLVLTDYELEQLRAAYEKSVNGTAASQYEQEEYVLYGTYEPLSVTLTHIINNKSGISFTSYSHTGLPVAVLAHGVNAGQFNGYYDNTQIYHKLAGMLGIRLNLLLSPSSTAGAAGVSRPHPPRSSRMRHSIQSCVFTCSRPAPLLSYRCSALRWPSCSSCLPTGYEGGLIYQEADRCTARVLATDDSTIVDTGLVRSGEQRCTLELLGGRFQGRTATGINMLNGSLEQDKLFAPGDKAMVVVSHQGDEITLRHHDRPLPHRQGGSAGRRLRRVPDPLRRAYRPAGHRLLRADGADAVEGAGAPLPQGLEPHPGRPGGYSGPHPADHRPGLRLRPAVRRRRVGLRSWVYWSHVCLALCLPTCFRSTGPLCPTRRVCSTPGIRIST